MRNALFAAAAALSLAAVPVGAQQADEPVPAGDLPSPGKATLISLGATLGAFGASWLAHANDQDGLGVGLSAAGALLGPAAGYVYGDRTGRGLAGAGIRAGGVALAGVGASGCELNIFGPSEDSGCPLVIAGAVVILTSMIYDLAVVDNRVRERNERRTARVGVAPYVGTKGGVGAVLTVRH